MNMRGVKGYDLMGVPMLSAPAPKRGPGRPRKPPTTLLTVRIPPAELSAYAARAAATGASLSAVVRRLLAAWAARG